MNAHPGFAAPEGGPQTDPEIKALLDFEPVPRAYKRPGSWTAEEQRKFIARLAVHGSPGKASEELGKDRGGARKLYNSPEGASFRAAWDSAVELALDRQAGRTGPGALPPTLDSRRHKQRLLSSTPFAGPFPGQVMNERGEWEDQASFRQRGEDAGDRIAAKLLRARRLYLCEISDNAGKRAAFEMLTELPIDWDKAAEMEPQADEPWRTPNMRDPDMILTAESGWLMGEAGYGPDKMAEVRKVLDDYRAKHGMEPIQWGEEK
jgi:hypothetical protein